MRPSLSSLNLKMATGHNSLMWFRKGLRLHDNPALEKAAMGSDFVYPVFVIDPHYMHPDPDSFSPGSTRAGLNRIRFLLESLVDLDANLRKIGSRLLVLKGDPSQVLVRCLKEVIGFNYLRVIHYVILVYHLGAGIVYLLHSSTISFDFTFFARGRNRIES